MSEKKETATRSGRTWNLILGITAAVSIFAVLVWVYQDSFWHAPKRDQIHYLIETCRSQSFGEILEKSWSFNRTRTVQPGDSQLFRPGLFLLLAVQSYLFDYHCGYFRWVSLSIHAAVTGLLFWLLYLLVKPYRSGALIGNANAVALPFGFALLFAFSCTIYDTVSWEHIQGYMVFIGLVLLGLIQFLKFERGETSRVRALSGAWLALFVATFFHEAGVGFAPIFGFCAVLVGRWRHRWEWKHCAAAFACFAAISAIYLAISFADYHIHKDRLIAGNLSDDLALGTSWVGTLYNYLRFTVYCCVQPMLPFLLKTESGATIGIRDFFFANPKNLETPLLNQGLLILAFLGVVFLVGRLIVRATRRREFFPLLVLFLLGAFVSLYVLLRLNVRAQSSYSFLGMNTQYVYICLPLALCLVIPALLEFISTRSETVRSRWVRWLGGYAIAMSILGAVQTWNCNRTTAKASVEIWEKFLIPGAKALDELNASGNRRVQFVFEDPEDFVTFGQYGVPITTILFGRHEVAENPDALVSLPSGKILRPDGRKIPYYVETLPFDVVTARKYGAQVIFHSSYVIYRYGERWVGLLCSYPLATLEQAVEYPFSVLASNREEIVRKSGETARFARQEAMEGRLLVGIASQPLVIGVRQGWTLLRTPDGYLAIRGTDLGGKEIMHRMSVAGSVLKADSKESLEAKVDLQRDTPR